MKRLFLLCAVAGIAAVSCNKDMDIQPSQQDAPKEKLEVLVGLSNVDLTITETRADLTATSAEKKVDDAYVLVYNASGNLVDYKAWSGSSVKFALEAGNYKFFAIINTGATSMPATVTALNALKGTLKADLSGFTMLGSTEKTIATGTEKFSISAKRLASKVVFKDLKVNFSSTSLQAAGMTLNAVYLINAAGEMTFASMLGGNLAAPGLWYNQLKYAQNDCDSYLYAGGLNLSAAHGSTKNVNKTFYAYPNGTASDAHGGSWSARKTRLVLEATVDGSKCYYPFTFDTLEPNKIYTVNSITVTRKGVANPDDVWNDNEVSGDLTIDDWTNGGEFSEEM